MVLLSGEKWFGGIRVSVSRVSVYFVATLMYLLPALGGGVYIQDE